jgi:NitT/TauT family transport system permease protein
MSVISTSEHLTVTRPRSRVVEMLRSDTVTGLVSIFILLALWQFAVVAFAVKPFILPAPTAIAARVWADASGELLTHLPTTVIEVLLGFFTAAVIGVVLGAGIALVPLIEKSIYPCVLAFQTVPKVAIAPLFIIWFGFGLQSKVVTAALIAFFPILVNVVAGLRSVDTRRLMLMRALRATPWQTFAKVRLPGMLPFLFAGLEIGLVFSIIGVIVGEFIGSSTGLGVLIIQRQGMIDVAGMFSVLIYLSLLGLALNFILIQVKKRMIYW